MVDLWVLLVIAGFFGAAAVYFFVKHRPAAAHWSILLGIMLVVALNLMVFIRNPWWNAATNAIVGVLMVSASIMTLRSPPQPKFPRWTQWATLVIGFGCLLFGAALPLYWKTGFHLLHR